MPTVPVLNTPSVTPETMPRPYELAMRMPGYAMPTADPIRVQSAPDTAGSTASQLGQGMQNAGAQTVSIADQMAQQANTMQVVGAVNQLRQAGQQYTYDPQQGYLNLKGQAALNRPDGQSLVDEYGGKMQDAYDQIAGNLGNPMQQRMFAEQASGVMSQFNNGVQAHVLQEFRDNGLSQLTGSMKLDANDAGQNWNNPDRVQQNVQNTQAAVYQMGQIQGWSADEIAANQAQATSAIHRQVIQSALQNENPTYATGYLQQNKSQMTPDDILAVQGLVNHQLDSHMALAATQGAVQQFSDQFNPSQAQRLLTLQGAQESGNKDYNADGTPVTSPAGAKYGMQVLPATAANPGHGIQPAQDDSPAEYNRVGQQLSLALVQKYGNVPQALAAYNAGEGNVDKAISDAQAAGQPQNWMNYLANYQSADNHQETVGYVNNIMSKLLNGGGAAPAPTESQFVSAAINALGPSPRIEQVALTREQATAQYAMQMKSRDELGQQAVQQAQQALLQNGGNLAQLDPSLRMGVAQYAPEKWDDLTNFAGHVADPVRSDNLGLYNDLTTNPQMLVTNPQTGQPWSQAEWSGMMVNNFKQPTAERFTRQREAMLNGTADTSAQSVNYQALNQALNPRLESIGLNPTAPRNTDGTVSDDQKRLGGIRQYLVDQVFQQQQQSGQKLTPQQINDLVGNVFSKDVTFKTSFIGIPTGSTTTNAMSMVPRDVPSDARKQIIAAYAAHGVSNPTDQQILRQFWSMNGVR